MGSLDAQRSGPCLPRPARRGRRRNPQGLRPAGPRPCRRNLEQAVRTAAPASAQACRLHGHQRHNLPAFLSFPRQHRTRLHSTNPIERLNKEVKRRADVVGIFPNEASIMRLIGAVLSEENDEGQTSSRYAIIEALAQIAREKIDPIPSITTKAA
ncbi:transposase [Plastorhodobacter daqingensis]|uniref:Mutator family transposase n=1 Tax=Plastorhodobacter daqingensis TaxID=1387281 RepID=A0ABW2UIK3_9RHOB